LAHFSTSDPPPCARWFARHRYAFVGMVPGLLVAAAVLVGELVG
jgi:hypothetical protein